MAIETQLQQTGSEVVNRNPNALLAYGSGDVDYALQPGVNPIEGMDKAFDNLYRQDFQMNMTNYAQKIKDRDEVNKMIAEGTDFTGNIPESSIKGPDGKPLRYALLDPDKQQLQTKADEIRQLVVNNPHIQQDRTQNTQLQSKLNEFKNLRNNAQARAVEAAAQRLDIVNEMDQEERAKRQQHLAGELQKGISHVPYPYMKPLSFDENIVSPDVKAAAKGEPTYYQDAKGVWHKKETMATPLAEFNNSGKYVPGNPYFTHAQNKYRRAVGSPAFFNEDFINKANTALAAINEKEGLTPDNPNFIQPLANIGEDGKIIPNQNVPAFVRSMHVLQKYKNSLNDGVAEDYQKAAKMYADQLNAESGTQKNKAETANINAKTKLEVPAHADQMRALAEKYRAEAALAKRKGDKLAMDNANERNDAIAPVRESYNVFDNYNKQTGFVPLAQLSASFTDKEKENLRNAVGSDAVSAIVVPSNDQKIFNILGKPQILTDQGTATGLGESAPKEGKVIGVIKPKIAYLVKSPDGDPNKSKLVGVYPDGEVIAVDRTQAVDRIIDNKSNYTRGEKMVKMKNASHLIMDELNNGGSQSPAPATGGALKRKEINGVVYEQGADGQWYKL